MKDIIQIDKKKFLSLLRGLVNIRFEATDYIAHQRVIEFLEQAEVTPLKLRASKKAIRKLQQLEKETETMAKGFPEPPQEPKCDHPYDEQLDTWRDTDIVKITCGKCGVVVHSEIKEPKAPEHLDCSVIESQQRLLETQQDRIVDLAKRVKALEQKEK